MSESAESATVERRDPTATDLLAVSQELVTFCERRFEELGVVGNAEVFLIAFRASVPPDERDYYLERE